MPRTAVFIDGFNLYHSINDLGSPHLKWSNYQRLSELIADPGDTVVKVVLATAYYPDFSKKVRHERHVGALQNVGVKVVFGHYVHEDRDCRGCARQWKKPTEKEGDINVALSLMDAAHRDLFDSAYLVSSDSDQAATARIFAKRFPNKEFVSVAPPGRSHSKHILAHAARHKAITEEHMDLSVFPNVVPGVNGSKAVICPHEWRPPAGWVHPNDRP